jgi:2'-hydroxyisoflavone reductase
MKILILGGTAFLGPHLVEHAIAHGHTVTLFNRGKTNPHLFPDVEKLRGDRNPKEGEGLKALEGRTWDAVIDTSGYVPREVAASAELLAPNVRQYLFVSTISVFTDVSKIGLNETDPVGTMPDPTVEQVTGETYGPLKALCEQAAEKAMPGRTTTVRPTLIVGPGDGTDRFTYWPVRIDAGGEVLAPGPQDAATQYIDVRDLAAFCIQLLEDGHAGTYNVAGPRGVLTFAELLHGCRAVTSAEVSFIWVDQKFLEEQQVGPWMEMAMWIPASPESAGFSRVSNAKAITHGLKFRPLADTARDTLEWHKKDRGADYVFGTQRGRAGLKPQREMELLRAWRERSATTRPSEP